MRGRSLVLAASFGVAGCAAVLGIEDGRPRAEPVAAGAAGAGSAGVAGAGGGAAAGKGGAAGAGGDGGGGGVAGAGAGGSGVAGAGAVAGAGGAGASQGGAAGESGAAGVGGGGAGGGGNGGTAGQGGTVFIPSLAWLRQLGSNGTDTATDLCSDSSDALYAMGKVGGPIDVAGASLQPEPSGDTRYLIKFDQSGALAWTLRVAGSIVTINQLIGARDGGVFVVGTVTGETRVLDATLGPGFVAPTTTAAGAFVMRVAAAGDVRWLRRFDGAAGRAITGKSVAELGDEVIVAGVFGGTLVLDGVAVTSAADDDVYVARFDRETGAVIAATRASSAGDDGFPQLVARGDGVLLAMTCGGVIDGISPPLSCDGLAVVDFDATLGVRRARSFAVDQPAQVLLAVTPTGQSYVAAKFSGAAALAPLAPLPSGANRTLVARLDGELVPVVSRLLPNPGASAVGAMVVDVDGGVLLGGWIRGCMATATGLAACTAPAAAQNGVTIKLTPALDVAWFGMQYASVASVNGVVTSLAISPMGALLGAANFSDKVAVGSAFVTSVGGVDGVVGRFE